MIISIDQIIKSFYMILRNAKRLFRLNAYPYVCHKELNRIKEKYG